MIRPPRGDWSFIARKASWAHRNAPVRLVATIACQSSKATSSNGAGAAERPGVVEQHVDAAELVAHAGEEGGDGLAVGDVGRHDDRAVGPTSAPASVSRSASSRRPASATR